MTTKTPPTKASPRRSPPKAAKAPLSPTPDRPPGEGAVVLAVVVGAHGVGGEVRLKSYSEDLDRYRTFNDGALTLRTLRRGGNGVIARFAEVPDRSAAENLRGTELAVPRAMLPPLEEGEYYHADLVGLPVETPDGVSLGIVVAIDNFGAGDVIEIERPTGKRFMVPMRPEAVPTWSGERIVVDPAFVE